MTQRGRGRRGESFIEILLGLPWQVSAGIGVVLFFGLKWVLPTLGAGSVLLMPAAVMASEMAWLFAGVFFLIGAVVFAKQKASLAKGLMREEPPIRGNSTGEQRTPSWAKHAANKPPFDPTVARGSLGEPISNAVSAPIEPDPVVSKPEAWTIDLLREIEWKRFEDVCQKFYELKGIRSETTPLGPDGGIDIRLYQDDSGVATSIVQCKAWGERFVGVKPVRELLGVMSHEKIAKAFFMTSGYFTDEAKAIASANRITLINGDMLLMMIQRLSADAQARLLAFAVEGDYSMPTCPSCGIKMRPVPGKEGRPGFWGCHNYPRCRQKLGMRRDRV